ncbi:MAG: LamG-like jellyroll fold domain-containing protein [Bacteroidota bacterium]
MIRRFIFPIILNGLVVFFLAAQINTASTTWFLDRTDSIGGYTTTALLKLPKIIETVYGKAALFSCYDSTALLVNCNPIGTDTAFTVEVYFRPDSTILAGTNNEQRFIHIRNLLNDNRRILLEIRQLQSQRWLLDTYIKSESSNLTLVDSSKSHSSGEWHHVALTYSNGTMRQFVDGVELLSGPVTYLPIDANGKTAIGARQDPRSWFNGAIRMVKVSKRALAPAEFSFPTTTKVQEIGEQSIKSNLLQNYPNPFNPTTNFTYKLEKEALVSIKMFNILGKEVATLVNEIKPAGTYETKWNASTFSSGVYLCKMQSGLYISIKKIILTK